MGHEGSPLLPPIDLQMHAGTFVLIVGRNGSGKTTFCRTLLGLQRPVSGRVARQRPDLRFAFHAQTVALDGALPLRSRDVVRWGRLTGWNFVRPRAGGDDAICQRALADAGATELGDRPFRDLSEGQKQRVLLARVLASEPDVALLDEPTSAMDVIAERDTLAHLGEVTRGRNMITVMVTHMLGMAAELADLVVFFDREDQAVVIGPPADVLAHELFRKQFGTMIAGTRAG